RLVREARDSRDIRLAGTPTHHPEAEAAAPELGMEPAAAGRMQGPGSEAPGAAADHPRPTAGVTWMTRVDRAVDLGVSGGPGVQATLPHVAGQVVHPERAHPTGRVPHDGGAPRIDRQAERGPRRIRSLVAPWIAPPIRAPRRVLPLRLGRQPRRDP